MPGATEAVERADPKSTSDKPKRKVETDENKDEQKSLSDGEDKFHPPNLSAGYVGGYYADDRPYGEPCVYQAKEGGLDYQNEEILNRTHGITAELLKSIGKTLLQGKSLVSISIPCRIFEPRTALQRILDCCGFKCAYLTKAAKCPDPVERMKYVITSIVAGFHLQIKQLKPFNPILGETFQATYPNGTNIFCEQVAHHPPISAFDIQDVQKRWRFWGRHEFTASMGMNTITGQQIGPNYVEFPDGTKIAYFYPDCVCSGGVIYGKTRTLTWVGRIYFRDITNGIAAEVMFGNKKGWFSFMSKAKRGNGEFDGEIFAFSNPPKGTRLNKDVLTEVDTERNKNKKRDHKKLSDISGDWTKAVNFDGIPYWTVGCVEPVFPIPIPDEECLPSDARFREDLVYLNAGDYENAQASKEKLEVIQRADKKLRKAAAKKHKKADSSGSYWSLGSRSR